MVLSVRIKLDSALGMAYFNLGEFNAARKAFREAAKDKRAKAFAQQWLKYINSEEKRLATRLLKNLGSNLLSYMKKPPLGGFFLRERKT